MKSRPVSLCLKVSPPSTAGSLGFFMVYIFFLFATVKPPVNSPGWFTCSENNVRHTALIGDERLQERLFVSVKPTSASSARPPPLSVPSRVCLRHFVWTRAKVPICCVSRFSAHGACTHDSLHISMCVCVRVSSFAELFAEFCGAQITHLCKDDTCPHTCELLRKDNSSSADTRPADGCWVLWLHGVFVC